MQPKRKKLWMRILMGAVALAMLAGVMISAFSSAFFI